MQKLKQILIEKALDQDQIILPCSQQKTLMDGFSFVAGRLVFWYNIPNGATHAVWIKKSA